MAWENEYLKLCANIATIGEERQDRTGVGVYSLFGEKLEMDLRDGFPAMTTKKLAWKALVSELLWFLEGTGDERRLCEILHGTRDASKKTIWTDNANASYWKSKAQYDGDLGRVYGVQWRNWRTVEPTNYVGPELDYPKFSVGRYDQLRELVQGIKTDPTGRRHIITAWNPGELNQQALPPCHMMAQFYVAQRTNELSCQMYQRSVDVCLGLPFNIASYALFTHLMAAECGLNVGKLHMVFGDTHIYKNHIDGVKQQLERAPHVVPSLKMNLPEQWSILNPEQLSIDMFSLENYRSYDAIKLKMAV